MKPEWLLPELNLQEIEVISQNTGIDTNIISILYGRGLKKEDDIIKFLYPEFNNFHNPFLMHGIYEAVKRLRKAIEDGEKIAIFGDSDLDGITSLTIIHNVLHKAGAIPAIRYPRDKEGYGLTCDIINEFIQKNIKLIITVDSGIRDVEEINFGKKNGIDFIVTDHHEPDTNLPDAIIVNPKKSECNYPYKELAGVGVVFKFIQAFLYSYTSGFDKRFVLIYKQSSSCTLKYIRNGIVTDTLTADDSNIISCLTTGIEPGDYIILTNNGSLKLSSIIKSINTNVIISDFKKIASSFHKKSYEDNRTMLETLISDFHIEIKNLNELEIYLKLFIELQWRSSKKILSFMEEYSVLVTIGTIADIMPLTGENRLLTKYGLSILNKKKGHKGILSITGKSNTTSKTISWDIAPLLNAPGRMGETELTVNFFLEQDEEKVSEILTEIQKINKKRKKIVLEIINKIKNDNSNNNILNDNIFFYMNEDIIDGLAGLIANRLADDLKKPVIIATSIDSNGFIKGSGRSSGNFNFFKYVSQFSHLFERVGGHAQAFGFIADACKITEIIQIINNVITDKFITDDSIKIDSIININDIDSDFIKNLSILEPFGKCNEEPVFAVKNVHPESCSSFGNNGNHGKFIMTKNLQAIGWNIKDKMISYFNPKKNIDLIFTLENNEYSGRLYPRMNILDIDFSD